MSKSPDEIFHRVRSEDEKMDLLRSLDHHKRFVSIKMISAPVKSQILRLQVKKLRGKLLILDLPTKSSWPSETGELSYEFLIGDDIFLGRAKFEKKEQEIALTVDQDLFRLQRRDNFRLKFPASRKAVFRSEGYEWRLVDLSAGGFRLQVSPGSKELPKKPIVGLLSIQGTDPVELQAQVVPFSEKQDSMGLKFVNLTPQVSNELHLLVMSLYRELFIRFK